MKDNLIISLLIVNVAILIKLSSDINKINKELEYENKCSTNIGYAIDNQYTTRWEE